MQLLRSILFTGFFLLFTFLYAIFFVIAGVLLPWNGRFALARVWARVLLGGLRVLCGLDYKVEGAANIPLYSLRLKLAGLDRNRHYVVCCDTGRRSSACAYILSERGFQASVLKGGLTATEIARK